MSAVGLGCVHLGSGDGARVRDDVRLVHRALELGVEVFDTSDAYGGGASEHVLGRALRGRRDGVVVATKGGFAFRARPLLEQWARRRAKGARSAVEAARARRTEAAEATSHGPGWSAGSSYAAQDLSPQHLRRSVHASLRRLGTDRIDVYQVHAPEVVVPHLLEALADLVATGDVVRFGVGAGSVAMADTWSAVSGVEVVQVPFGVLDPEAAATTFGLAGQRGQEVWVRGILGGGVLGRFTADPRSVVDEVTRARVEALAAVARDSGLGLQELAIGFVLAHADEISTVLVGTSSVDHLERNVAALGAPPLSPDVLAALQAIVHAPSEPS